MKLFYFDTETTGLDSNLNDIIQLACLVEINGEVVEEANFKIQPRNWETISLQALQVNKITLDELKTFTPPDAAHINLKKFLNQYVNPYDRNDKFIPVGYNLQFDMGFLQNFFKKNGDKFFGSYFNYKGLDPYPIIFACDYLFKWGLPNHKLETVAKCFGLEHDAHDALSDIKVTRRVWQEICLKSLTNPVTEIIR